MVGLSAGTRSLAAVMGGILVISVADAMSDALGMHVAQEADPEVSVRHVWSATLATFLSKFLVAVSFALPLLWLPLSLGVAVGVAWGLLLVGVASVQLARTRAVAVLPVIAEHLVIAVLVVLVSHGLGRWVQSVFG